MKEVCRFQGAGDITEMVEIRSCQEASDLRGVWRWETKDTNSQAPQSLQLLIYQRGLVKVIYVKAPKYDVVA